MTTVGNSNGGEFGFGRDENGIAIVDLRTESRRERHRREEEQGVRRARLYIIRHGQSHANASWDAGGRYAALPPPRHGPEDSPLTQTGHDQAMRLGERMRSFRFMSDRDHDNDRVDGSECSDREDEQKNDTCSGVLFVSSPLTRALETSMGILRGLGTLSKRMPALTIEPHIAEHIACESDKGRLRGELEMDFPGLSTELSRVFPDPEKTWWWSGRSRFGCEPFESLHDRLRAFHAYIGAKSRSYKTIIVVGHSTFIQQLFSTSPVARKLASTRRLRNCECVNVLL